MNNNFGFKTDRYILYFTVPIIILVSLCSSIGIWNETLYFRETANWLAQCVGQDISNLFFVVPILLISGIYTSKGNKIAAIIWCGTMITNIYSYVIYCFAVHFNFLFHVYCLILGLSIFSLLYFFVNYINEDFKKWFDGKLPVKSVGGLLIFIAAMFILLWTCDSLPAVLKGIVPDSIKKDDLITNPVQALDYSFFLPLMIISAVGIIKKKRLAYILAPMMITFAIITNIDIISLTFVSMRMNISSGIQLIIVFSIFTFICLAFLWIVLKGIKTK